MFFVSHVLLDKEYTWPREDCDKITFSYCSVDVSTVSIPLTIVSLSLTHCKLYNLSRLVLPESLVHLNLSHNRIRLTTLTMPAGLKVLNVTNNNVYNVNRVYKHALKHARLREFHCTQWTHLVFRDGWSFMEQVTITKLDELMKLLTMFQRVQHSIPAIWALRSAKRMHRMNKLPVELYRYVYSFFSN